ncbi:hypothetical protein HK097_008846, partial [Rhizophlyctis rosea]
MLMGSFPSNYITETSVHPNVENGRPLHTAKKKPYRCPFSQFSRKNTHSSNKVTLAPQVQGVVVPPDVKGVPHAQLDKTSPRAYRDASIDGNIPELEPVAPALPLSPSPKPSPLLNPLPHVSTSIKTVPLPPARTLAPLNITLKPSPYSLVAKQADENIPSPTTPSLPSTPSSPTAPSYLIPIPPHRHSRAASDPPSNCNLLSIPRMYGPLETIEQSPSASYQHTRASSFTSSIRTNASS